MAPTIPSNARPAKGQVVVSELEPEAEDLFESLRVLRKRLADDRQVPAYVVFSDASLREMASTMPSDAQEFLAINGVGAAKLETYGEVFLEAIAAWRNR